MKPFRINLSTRYRWYLAPLRMALILVSAACLVGTVWELRYASLLYTEAAQLEPALARVVAQDEAFVAEARRKGLDLSDTALARLPRDVEFANRLIAERTFSWTALLGELEQTVPDGLAISGVQHDLGKSVVIRLTGSALSLEAITAFTLALTDHPAFYDVELVQHRLRERTGVVDFNLRVGYRSPSA